MSKRHSTESSVAAVPDPPQVASPRGRRVAASLLPTSPSTEPAYPTDLTDAQLAQLNPLLPELAWITGHRRCVRDYERLRHHHEAMVRWSMIRITSRRLVQSQ